MRRIEYRRGYLSKNNCVSIKEVGKSEIINVGEMLRGNPVWLVGLESKILQLLALVLSPHNEIPRHR